MAVYWRDGEDWKNYLHRQAIPEDTADAVQKITPEIASQIDIPPSTDGESAPDNNTFVLNLISQGIMGLSAAFDMAMGKVLWKLQVEQETLNDILAELRPEAFERDAKIFRQRAEEAYVNGWYQEALRDYQEAEKRNDRDFSVLRSIGNIYLYEVFDYTKALQYFTNSAKYAGAYSKEFAAEALLFAGWVCYLRRADADAIRFMRGAYQMNPNLTQALYYHAKFAAANGNAKLAIPSLEKAILVNRHYLPKADSDHDFDAIRPEIQNLQNRLCQQARIAGLKIFDLGKVLQEYYIKPCLETQPLLNQLREIAGLFKKETTYFNYLDILQKLKKCKEIFEGLRGYRRIATLEGHRDWIRTLAFNPDGTLLASAARDEIRIWNLAARTQIARIQGESKDVASVAFDPASQFLTSALSDGTIRFWDVATQQQKARISGHTNWVQSIAFSPDGKFLASGSEDGTVRLWDARTRRQITQLKADLGETVQFWDNDSVYSVVFSPDGQFLAAGGRDKTVRIWDVGTKRQIALLEGHTSWVQSVAFSSDGRFLASGSRDNTIRLWDIATKQEVAVLVGHTGWVHAVAFSPVGSLLASGSKDKTIRLWDPETRTQLAQLDEHRDWVHTLSFSPDGSLLASGSGDCTIQLRGVNLIITKAEKAAQDQLQHGSERRRNVQNTAREAIDNAQQFLEEAVVADASVYAPIELNSDRDLLVQSESAFGAGQLDDSKSYADQARKALIEVKELAQSRSEEDERQ